MIFATLIGVNYFVQISAVRFNLQMGQFAGLEQVLQANPLSAMSAINMLGFTLFLACHRCLSRRFSAAGGWKWSSERPFWPMGCLFWWAA